MLPWFAVLMTTAGVLLAGLAGYVGWRRGSRAGAALAVLLAAVAWWGLAYAFELTATDVATKSRWGDLKYVGIAVLAPAWLVFVLEYTNRGHLVTRRLLVLLAIEPLLLMVCLFVPATHDLVRYYPAGAAGVDLPGDQRWAGVLGAPGLLEPDDPGRHVVVRGEHGEALGHLPQDGARPRRGGTAALGGQPAAQLQRRLVRHHRPDPVRVHPDRLCARLGTVPRATDPPDAAGVRGGGRT